MKIHNLPDCLMTLKELEDIHAWAMQGVEHFEELGDIWKVEEAYLYADLLETAITMVRTQTPSNE